MDIIKAVELIILFIIVAVVGAFWVYAIATFGAGSILVGGIITLMGAGALVELNTDGQYA